VGLGRFAQVALDVAQVMPPYRTCFSKRQFSQPQLLAILCFMRYEDWTFRETEVRLSEHGELRRALALASVPDTTPRSSRSCDVSWNPTWSTPSRIVVRRVPGRRRRRTTVAVDATGLAQGAVSTFLVRRMYHHTQQRKRLSADVGRSSEGLDKKLPWRRWLKWSAVVDVERQLILSQSARQAPGNSSVAHLGPLSHQG